MAASLTSKPTTKPTPNRLNRLGDASGFRLALPVAVAYSGGADSTALLLMLTQQHPGQVHAIHVHHGLQAAADDFAAHCAAFCDNLNVPLHLAYANAAAAQGQSPEDAARRARYAALLVKVKDINKVLAPSETAQNAINSIAVAQHADDQIETLLLALSRGAGLPGLSAMPAKWERGGVPFVRPLLEMSAQEIRMFLAGCGLVARRPGDPNVGCGWVEDPSNLDAKFTRNRIRQQLIPTLEKTFPQFRKTFFRSTRHAAQAQALLTELAIEDLAITENPPHIAALQDLTPQRQANVLRHWLKTHHQASPSTAQLAELQSQITHCTNRSQRIHIKIASGHVLRLGNALHYVVRCLP